MKKFDEFLNEDINPVDPYGEEDWNEVSFKRGQKVKKEELIMT